MGGFGSPGALGFDATAGDSGQQAIGSIATDLVSVV
jgi:hypothetical protein